MAVLLLKFGDEAREIADTPQELPKFVVFFGGLGCFVGPTLSADLVSCCCLCRCCQKRRIQSI